MPSSVPAGKATGRARNGRVLVPFAAERTASMWSRELGERMYSCPAATARLKTAHSGRSGSEDWRGGCFPETRPGGEVAGAGEPPHQGPRAVPSRSESVRPAQNALWAPLVPPGAGKRPPAALGRVRRAAARRNPLKKPASGAGAAHAARDRCGRAHGPFPQIRTRRQGDGRHSGGYGARATRSLRRCVGSRGKKAEARW